MLAIGSRATQHIDNYSTQFQDEFVALLSRRWGTKRIKVNQCYQEYIQDKNHLHMNSTRFLSLTEFAKHLGKTGVAHVDEVSRHIKPEPARNRANSEACRLQTEKGWFISWIDNSPAALARQAESQKKQRGEVDEETRQRRLIEEQVRRAKEQEDQRRRAQAAASGAPLPDEEPPEVNRELIRDEGEKVSLSLSFKAKPTTTTDGSVSPPTEAGATPSTAATDATSAPAASAAPVSNSTSTFIAPPVKAAIGFTPRPNAFKVASKPLAGNAFKAGSALKTGGAMKANPLAGKPMSISLGGAGAKRPAPMSAVEAIFQEEMARKSGGGGGGPKRGRYD